MEKKTFGELMRSLRTGEGKLSYKKWMQWRERGNTNFTQLAEKMRKQGEVLISKKIGGKMCYKIARKEDGQDITDFFDKQMKRIISGQIRNAIRIRNLVVLSAENKKIVIESLRRFEAEQINESKNKIREPEALEEELIRIKIYQIERELLLEAEVNEIKEYFTMNAFRKVQFLEELKGRR